MSDKIKFKIISEGKRFENDFSKLSKSDRDIFTHCYLEADQEENELSICILFAYEFMPVSLKTEILTQGLEVESIQYKITTWIRDEYLPNKHIHDGN